MFGFEGENAREKVIVLFTMCFALAMAMLDNTVVNVALPTISRELGAGVSELQWIVDGYVLVFASLLLTGGIAGDRYGRKKIFMAGLAIFTLASALCGLSQSTTQLIAARAFQGVGAALLMPGTLSIITVTFPPHERAKAIGLWAGMSGLALALGPTVGGLMVEHLGWESVFFLNVPIGIIALLTASRTVRESVSEVTRELDIPGLLLGSGALFCATYALIEANEKGWSDPLIVSMLVASAVLAVAFLLFERQSPKAMLPLRFFRIPAFSAGATVAFSVSFGMFATFFFMSLYMQLIRGYSAFQAGVRFLPMTVMIIIVAPNAGRYASKHGSRIPMTFGLILAGTGLLLLSRISIDTPYLLHGAGLRDDGHRDRRHDGADDGRGHERGGPRTRGPRFRHDEHRQGGRRRVRHRAAGHDPHHEAQRRIRSRTERARPRADHAIRDRGDGRTRHAGSLAAVRAPARAAGCGGRGLPRILDERLPRLARRGRAGAAGRGGGRQPVHPRPCPRSRGHRGRPGG